MTAFSIPTPKSDPLRIVAGPDGALWFTEHGGNKIGRITPAGHITEFPIPNGAQPWGIALAPDGALWFTEARGTMLGRMTTTGIFAHLPFDTCCGEGEMPQKPLDPRDITVGPDGAVWFAELEGFRIIRVGLASPAPAPATATAAG